MKTNDINKKLCIALAIETLLSNADICCYINKLTIQGRITATEHFNSGHYVLRIADKHIPFTIAK